MSQTPAETNAMTADQPEPPPTMFSWVQVALGWILVGVPLLWGILITFKKAAPLFR